MRLRQARKIAKKQTGNVRPPHRVNPETARRAALRLHKSWWRRHGRDTGLYTPDWFGANRLRMTEWRRRHYLWSLRNGFDKHAPRAGEPGSPFSVDGAWPSHIWVPDGVRARIAADGGDWLANWREAMVRVRGQE